jgi:hypothetical protein
MPPMCHYTWMQSRIYASTAARNIMPATFNRFLEKEAAVFCEVNDPVEF